MAWSGRRAVGDPEDLPSDVRRMLGAVDEESAREARGRIEDSALPQRELYEAASIDGASAWRQFRSITVPLLSPSIFFLTIMTTIGGFQLFDALFAMIGTNNPAEPRTRSLVYLFYREAFVNSDQGMGAAVAVVIFACVAVVTFVQFLGQRRWVNYV